jgi:hypothetical protein
LSRHEKRKKDIRKRNRKSFSKEALSRKLNNLIKQGNKNYDQRVIISRYLFNDFNKQNPESMIANRVRSLLMFELGYNREEITTKYKESVVYSSGFERHTNLIERKEAVLAYMFKNRRHFPDFF